MGPESLECQRVAPTARERAPQAGERPLFGRNRTSSSGARRPPNGWGPAATGLVAAGALLAGCTQVPAGEGVDGDPAAAAGNGGGEMVRLAVGHQTRWRELRIDGETDLPDGAVVTWQVTHAAANELPRGEWPAQNLIADGSAVVQDGVYWTRLNTTYWPPGRVEVVAQFPVAPQPDAVRLRYGAFGERLTGDNVSVLGGSRVVTAEHAFDWTR